MRRFSGLPGRTGKIFISDTVICFTENAGSKIVRFKTSLRAGILYQQRADGFRKSYLFDFTIERTLKNRLSRKPRAFSTMEIFFSSGSVAAASDAGKSVV